MLPNTLISETRQESNDGDTAVVYSIHEFERFLTNEEIEEFLRVEYPATRCHHSHDCCGNFYARTPTSTRVEHHGDVEILLVRQTWCRNV